MATKKKVPQYFLGGAHWDNEDQYSDFITSGRWESGWKSETDKFMPIIKEMNQGDRIAIKKMLGKGSSQIQIRAIGIIKSIDTDRGIVYVNWVRKGMKRKVDSSNAFATLHGPYLNSSKHADWINQIFCLGCDNVKEALIFSAFIFFKKYKGKDQYYGL